MSETKRNGEWLAFEEASTGNYLLVEPTDDEHVFRWTSFDKNENALKSGRVSTTFDEGGGINKAADAAMTLAGINPLDVYADPDNTERLIDIAAKHHAADRAQEIIDGGR